MDENPTMFEILHENCKLVQDAFSNIHGLEIFGDSVSPIKHLRISAKYSSSYFNNDRKKIQKAMQRIVEEVKSINYYSLWITYWFVLYMYSK